MDDFTGILIEIVRANKCIYDKGHPGFKNPVEKEKAWVEVSAACGRSREECRRKWMTLREKFAKEEKKIDLPSGSGALNEEWPYYQNMLFLKQFIQPRRTRKNTFETSSESLDTESDASLQIDSQTPKKKKIGCVYGDLPCCPIGGSTN